MKKILALLVFALVLTGCSVPREISEDARRFREEYESLNGVSNGYDGNYRTVKINEDNPFEYATVEDIVRKMKNGESFIVYFGANWCPWCRCVIPFFIEECARNKISKVYYVDVRPDNDMDKDIRDEYSLDDNNEVYLSQQGTRGYHEFIKMASDVLDDYSRGKITSLDGTPFEGAKRVGAPNFIVIENGKAIRMSLCTPASLEDPYMILDDKIKQDIRNEIEELLNG